MSEHVTLASMSVTNFRGIESAKVRFTGGAVWISGNNGEGKSSFLAAVATLFFGVEYAGQVPLREGADSGEISGTLSNGLHARMRVTKDGVTSLTVTDKSGLKLGTPRAVLNKLIGSLAFDPLRFMSEMDSKQQIEQLKAICGLDFKLLDRDRAEAYQRRTDVNRELKAAAAALDKHAPHDSTAPAEPIDTAALMEQLRKAREHNSQADKLANEIQQGEAAEQRQRQLIDDLKRQLEAAVEKHKTIVDAIAARKATLAAFVPAAVADIEAAIADSGQKNAALQSNRNRAALRATVEKWQAESDRLTKLIDEVDQQKTSALAAAKMPIEGLGFTDDFVTYRGKPLSQASTREQMEVSFAICASLNPALRTVIIPHGSLITPSNRAHFEAIAEKYGMQPLVELADETGEVPGIVIEAGKIKRADDQPTEEPFDPTVSIALPDVTAAQPTADIAAVAPWAV